MLKTLHPLALGLAAALLSACSSSDPVAPAPEKPASSGAPATPAATGLSGTVAVGVAITQGKLRIVDASGTEIARDIAVADDGSYSVPTVTGTAPYRLEACGFAGADFMCITSVAQTLGTANVTPLTHAAVLLATGRTPDAVMAGSASDLSSSSLAGAQAQLRTGLAGVMEGHVPAGFDFVTGALAAGTRSGYDRVLDSLGVATGTDGGAFVQITPRVGSGNLFLQAGSSSGSVTVNPAAASLSLDGLDALFAQMTRAVASSTACSSGMAANMASNARLAFGGDSMNGPGAVASALCGLFGEGQMWGARLASPTLGRCDLSGSEPTCRISFVIEGSDGSRSAMSNGLGVVRQGGAWKFLGSAYPVQIEASARTQRTRRLDGTAFVDRYERALAIEIQAAPGVQCAKASQRDSSGNPVTVAFFKPFGDSAQRLSVWRDNNEERSLNATEGRLRGGDDTWLMLPEGASGDAVVRNFFRGGRMLTVALYGDASCSTPVSVGGQSAFEVDIDGVPPVWEAMPSLPWPMLSTTSAAALGSLTLAAGASTELALSWSYPQGRAGIGEISFCADMERCGDGEPGRIGFRNVSPAVLSTTLTLNNGGQALGSARMLALYGRSGDGLNMQSNFMVCPGTPAGLPCR